MTDTPGTLEERLRLTDIGFLNAHALTCEEEGLHKVAEAFRGIAQRADQAADEIASLRARVEVLTAERKTVLQNQRVNYAIQTALERGELHVTMDGYLKETKNER